MTPAPSAPPGSEPASGLRIGVRYDLRGAPGGTPHAALYTAAIEQCAWLETRGVDHVQLSEHHGAEDGYCPSPLVLAAAIGARTRELDLLMAAVVLPLHDPLRIAEDVAVADLASGGRIHLGCVTGYRESEFTMFGRDHRERGRSLEAAVEILKQAWTGEPFLYEGRPALVTPRPARQPRPPIYLGGRTVRAAERAARIADGMLAGSAEPAVVDAYFAERRRLGLPDGLFTGPGGSSSVFVTEDPDRAWAVVGPHALRETNSYAAWSAGQSNVNSFSAIQTVDELRRAGTYAFVTPEECAEMLQRLRPHTRLVLHPLIGGLDPDIGWESIELFCSKVIAPVGDGEA